MVGLGNGRFALVPVLNATSPQRPLIIYSLIVHIFEQGGEQWKGCCGTLSLLGPLAREPF